MLILSRKVGEELRIGDGTTVVVQAITGGRVRLGVLAPREVSVLRGELSPLAADSLVRGASDKYKESPR